MRSRAQLTYTGVQAAVDAGRAEGTEALLAEVGPRRQAIEAARGGVSLDLPTQRVLRGARRLPPRARTGRAGHGLERADLAADRHDRGDARCSTPAWACCGPSPRRPRRSCARCGTRPSGSASPGPMALTTPPWCASLDGDVPDEAALLALAARGLRGAGYLALLPGEASPQDDGRGASRRGGGPLRARHGAAPAPGRPLRHRGVPRPARRSRSRRRGRRVPGRAAEGHGAGQGAGGERGAGRRRPRGGAPAGAAGRRGARGDRGRRRRRPLHRGAAEAGRAGGRGRPRAPARRAGSHPGRRRRPHHPHACT